MLRLYLWSDICDLWWCTAETTPSIFSVSWPQMTSNDMTSRWSASYDMQVLIVLWQTRNLNDRLLKANLCYNCKLYFYTVRNIHIFFLDIGKYWRCIFMFGYIDLQVYKIHSFFFSTTKQGESIKPFWLVKNELHHLTCYRLVLI